jgi:YggT family protein
MLTQTLIYILDTLVGLFVLAVLTRFYAQAMRASFRNPLAQFIVALTDWAVKPLRRVVPALMGLDTASFLVAWIAEILLCTLELALLGMVADAQPLFWPTLFGYALVKVARLSIYLLMGVVIFEALLSWVAPFHPLRPFFEALGRPFMRPLRRIMPLIGGVDLSPLLLLIVLQVLLMLPVTLLENELFRLLRTFTLA